MAHIFFERLEKRRSTQTLYSGYTGYSAPYSDIQTYYGIATPVYGISNPYPFPSTDSISPWNSGYSLFMPYNQYPVWNNPFSQYSSSWMNPFSNFLGGIGSFISPFWNNFRGFFGWQPSPLPVVSYPGYTNPWSIFPGEIRALYAISIGPATTTPSYSPPTSTAWALYGISAPTSYWPSNPFTPRLLYAVSIPAATSSAMLF